MNRKVLLGAIALAGMLVISAPVSAAVDDPIYDGDQFAIVLMDVSDIGHAIEMLPPSADGLAVKSREFRGMAALDDFDADLVKQELATGLDAVAPMVLPIDRFAGLSPGDDDDADSLMLMQLSPAFDFGTTSRRYDPGWRVI